MGMVMVMGDGDGDGDGEDKTMIYTVITQQQHQ